MEWRGEVDITADQAVGAAAGGGDKKKQRGEQDKVQTFLQVVMNRAQPDLLDGTQGVLAKPVIEEAKKHGITEKQLKTARKKLGIDTKQRKGGVDGCGFGGMIS